MFLLWRLDANEVHIVSGDNGFKKMTFSWTFYCVWALISRSARGKIKIQVISKLLILPNDFLKKISV